MKVLRYVSFMLFGVILSIDITDDIFPMLLIIVFVFIYLSGTTNLLKKILGSINAVDKKMRDDVFNKGFVAIVPFAVFAFVSTFIMQWEMTQIFISTGLMAAVSLTGAEFMKTNPKKINILLPTGYGFMVFLVLTQIIGRL